MEGIIRKEKEPKYKVGEIVYFLDIFTNWKIPTVRQGRIIFAGNEEVAIHSLGNPTLILENDYIIENKGKNYRASQGFICKNEKTAKRKFSYAKFEL